MFAIKQQQIPNFANNLIFHGQKRNSGGNNETYKPVI